MRLELELPDENSLDAFIRLGVGAAESSSVADRFEPAHSPTISGLAAERGTRAGSSATHNPTHSPADRAACDVAAQPLPGFLGN